MSKKQIKKIAAEVAGNLSMHTVSSDEVLSQYYGMVMVYGDTQVTLPSVAATQSKPMTIKNMDGGTQTILPPLGVQVEFSSALNNNAKGNTWTIVSDGTQYLVL